MDIQHKKLLALVSFSNLEAPTSIQPDIGSAPFYSKDESEKCFRCSQSFGHPCLLGFVSVAHERCLG